MGGVCPQKCSPQRGRRGCGLRLGPRGHGQWTDQPTTGQSVTSSAFSRRFDRRTKRGEAARPASPTERPACRALPAPAAAVLRRHCSALARCGAHAAAVGWGADGCARARGSARMGVPRMGVARCAMDPRIRMLNRPRARGPSGFPSFALQRVLRAECFIARLRARRRGAHFEPRECRRRSSRRRRRCGASSESSSASSRPRKSYDH